MIKITIDSRSDALYVGLRQPVEASRSVDLDERVTIDYAEDGSVIGIEVLGAGPVHFISAE